MEDMEKKEITIELITSIFKNYSDKKKLKEIKDAVVSLLHPEDIMIEVSERERIENEVVNIISIDKKKGDESDLQYSSGKYYKRKKKPLPNDGNLNNSIYTGTAGECAVISELLFSGYNANRMMIDDGVDIIAVKDNVYYYVQVKTTSIKNGRIYQQINMDRFLQYKSVQIRYVIVVRYNDKGIDRNMFFSFTPKQIEEYIFDQCVKRGADSVSIKIRFEPKSGKPYLYDVKEKECSFNWNRKDLLE